MFDGQNKESQNNPASNTLTVKQSAGQNKGSQMDLSANTLTLKLFDTHIFCPPCQKNHFDYQTICFVDQKDHPGT